MGSIAAYAQEETATRFKIGCLRVGLNSLGDDPGFFMLISRATKIGPVFTINLMEHLLWMFDSNQMREAVKRR